MQVLGGFQRDLGALNVIIRADGDMHYFTPLGNYIVLNRSTYTSNGDAKSFTHELGHFFGLVHTHRRHEIPCFREPVSRGNVNDIACLGIGNYNPFVARCSYTGDALCDTEADPNMSWSGRYNTTTCNYTGTVEDYRGDRYRPLPHNYMAYGNDGCESQFTEQQVGVILYTIENNRNRCPRQWREDQPDNIFDIYEPNNTISGATNVRRIELDGTITGGRIGLDNVLRPGMIQTHSFHKVPQTSNLLPIVSSLWDDFDYIPLEAPIRFDILDGYTIKVYGDVHLIEDIELFTATEANGVIIEQEATNLMTVSGGSGSQFVLHIPCNVINSRLNGNRIQYYLRVRRNTETDATGIYYLSMVGLYRPQISGLSLFCQSTSIEQTINTNSDYTVSWSHQEIRDGQTLNQNGFIALFPTSPNTVTLNASIESGTYLLCAEVTNNYTGCSTRINKNIRVGEIPIANMQIIHSEIAPQETCPNVILRLRADLIEENGIDWDQVEEIEWISSSPYFPIITDPTQRAIQVRTSRQAFDYVTITLRLRNSCGWSEVSQYFRVTDNTTYCIPHHSRIEMQTYPNPTKSDIKVIFKVECQDCTNEELENLYPKIDESTIVMLNDAFGNVRLQYTGKQIPVDINKNIHLNLESLPVGNYVLKVITKEEVFFAHIIKE